MKKPFIILIKIAELIVGKQNNEYLSNPEISKLIKQFQQTHSIKKYHLSQTDIIIIAYAWFETVKNYRVGFASLDILKILYKKVSQKIEHLDDIISLLDKKVFAINPEDNWDVKQTHFIKQKPDSNFSSQYLLENVIEIHPDFKEVILAENKSQDDFSQKSFQNNRELLNYWFSYLEKVADLKLRSHHPIFNLFDLAGKEAAKFSEIVKWEKQIESRLANTDKKFPLLELIDEYNLDKIEAKIIVYLAKEELENNGCNTQEIIQLISIDHQDLFKNKKYISDESKLVKKGLVEISEGFFFRSQPNIRISPDILRRIIMKSPVNENETLNRILKGNDIFTIATPSQTFADLILPKQIKNTIRFSMNQYHKNIAETLQEWGLFDKGIRAVDHPNENTGSGMLMLFYGPPGTGKTFAAGAIAESLNKKLLITDVSRIQSKWVGDSEKNVRKMFSLFARIVNRMKNPPILLLNEADQFLMNRTEKIKSSVDRMHNSMQNLFLEGFENLNGILIATTNMRKNLDEAFSRRFQLKLEFPFPSGEERQKLWELHLPLTISGASEIDIKFLAANYRLTGGQIKIIVRNACIEGASRRLKRINQEDIIKYCDIEAESDFGSIKQKIVGF
ncbi:MAG: AAA family ATPase [Candidatus Cloacimonadota bacterium]|nr:AAA family ATPase [Candidatus Cloacimonadota bacterium]